MRGRNLLLGNKDGLMLHLPAGNGASSRSLHRSKWYGVSRDGRKFLEAVVCRTSEGELLTRRHQDTFSTDGVIAERHYRLPEPVAERFFVPDHVSGMVWSQHGGPSLEVEPYILMRFLRGGAPDEAYNADMLEGICVVRRDVGTTEESGGEGADTSGVPDILRETLWTAICVSGGSIHMRSQSSERWQPMWYSTDAARRRYLRRLALQNMVEHAPMWELATDWAYSPVTIRTADGCAIAMGFGLSMSEAMNAAKICIEQRSELEREKRENLAQLLTRGRFSTGHKQTDRAYGHVLARVIDCLAIEGRPKPLDSSPISYDPPRVLAGNAYFQESWSRDENISLGGLLAAGQYDLARKVVESGWRLQDERTGRLPLRYRPGEVPGYTSSDGTLWALIRLHQYTSLSGDLQLLQQKSPMVAHFFRRSLMACVQGLLPSGGLAVEGHDWETWMDTEFSARSGFPIEIQLLWLASLTHYTPIVRETDQSLADQMDATSQRLLHSFELFRSGEYFVDHLTRDLEPVDLLTPNSYFWTVLGLAFEWEWEKNALALGERELAGMSGVRTLARSQWETVLGPAISALARSGRPLPSVGKANYHRGVEWNWLSQLFVSGELRHACPERAFGRYLARQVLSCTSVAGIGGISEVFDHRGPAGPDFQTWSMTGLLESLHRFTGVAIDVPNRKIEVRPQKPRRWAYIKTRKWYARSPMDVEYETRDGEHRLTVAFGADPPTEVSLSMEICMTGGRTPRMVRIETGTASKEIRNCDMREEPHRVVVEVPAEQWQRLIVR